MGRACAEGLLVTPRKDKNKYSMHPATLKKWEQRLGQDQDELEVEWGWGAERKAKSDLRAKLSKREDWAGLDEAAKDLLFESEWVGVSMRREEKGIDSTYCRLVTLPVSNSNIAASIESWVQRRQHEEMIKQEKNWDDTFKKGLITAQKRKRALDPESEDEATTAEDMSNWSDTYGCYQAMD